MKEGNMDQKLSVEIVGCTERRPVKREGDNLVPGDITCELALKFPNGDVHNAQVSSETFQAYLDALHS